MLTSPHHEPIRDAGIAQRELNDGREVRIVRMFYTPDQLLEKLRAIGWDGTVESTGRFFYRGLVMPSVQESRP